MTVSNFLKEKRSALLRYLLWDRDPQIPQSISGLLSSYGTLVARIIIQQNSDIFLEIAVPWEQTFRVT
jgi:hypothetical protein